MKIAFARILAAGALTLEVAGCSAKKTPLNMPGSQSPATQASAGAPGGAGIAAGAPSTGNGGPVAGGKGAAPPMTALDAGMRAILDAGHTGAPTSNTNGPDAGTTSGDAASPSSSGYWQPKAGTTWDWQLSSIDTSHMVAVYDIDYENDKSVLDTLHGKGIHVICYVSVGSLEDSRPDASKFPAAVVGKDYPGWPGEKFLDIRSTEVRTLMAARFDICKSKGFDGLEPDNMDVFEDDSGFPLTSADGLDYAKWLADQAHSRGLAIFQKNTSSLTSKLVDLYDGAITEDCFDQNWCDDMKGYIQRNKPVFMAEYTDTGVSFPNACSYAKTNQYSAILKDRDLTSMLMTCP